MQGRLFPARDFHMQVRCARAPPATMSEPGGDDAGWRPPSDEAGEQASVFEARIVPAATQQEASAALLAAISRHIAVQSKLPPPHGPDG